MFENYEITSKEIATGPGLKDLFSFKIIKTVLTNKPDKLRIF